VGESIVVLMGQAMAKLRAVEKDRRFDGPGGFNFRGIDACMNAVGPVFRELGIVGPVPTLLDIAHDTVNTGKRDMQRCIVKVRYDFLGPNLDVISAVVPGVAMDTGDKADAKAMSVACRIALLQTLCLPTQEADPDDFVDGLTPVEMARNSVIDAMGARQLDPATVIARYAELYDGADPRTDTNIDRLHSFARTL
jgi:hypothetical protein